MKNKIDVLDYASHILKETKKGIIITAKSNNKVKNKKYCTVYEISVRIYKCFINLGRNRNVK